MPDIPLPTPDNTPLPGGGSWRWSIESAGWVESSPAATNPNLADVPAPAPAVAKAAPSSPAAPIAPNPKE